MSPEKIKLLKELQELENKWSSELLTHGGVHTGMTKIESDIRSKRNSRLRVATKYPNLTNDFLISKGVTQYKLIISLGATETYPFIGSSEIITDITSTGKTLADNNLRVLKDGLILSSNACLFIAKKKAAKLQPFLKFFV